MRISVVTVSFNQGRFLRRAMDSVVSQSWPDKEYIVVDPGSSDDSRAIILGYGERVTHAIFEPDAGAADGLNKGFALTTGDILCFLNSDDEFLPGAFERMARAFEARPAAALISGCGYFIDEQGRRGARIVPTRLSVADYLHGAYTLFQQGTFFRRRCWNEAGGFNKENRTCWDGELFFQFVRAGLQHDIIYEDVAQFRIHAASITGSGRLEAMYLRDTQRIFENAKGRPKHRGDELISTCLRATKVLRHPRYALERLRPR